MAGDYARKVRARSGIATMGLIRLQNKIAIVMEAVVGIREPTGKRGGEVGTQ